MKNKIFIRLIGGYGNQLFIYSFGLALAKKTGKELIIDNISGFGSMADEYKSEFAMDGLDIEYKLISHSRYRYFVANKYFWYLIRRLGLSYVEEFVSRFKDIGKTRKSFFEGYWQSYLYFDKYKAEIKKNLSLIDNNNSNILAYKKTILECKDSVAIGMRFYEETKSASQVHVVKSNKYYKSAMSLIEKKIPNPKYFVFSTDVKRAKKIIGSLSNKNIVFINPIRTKHNAKYDLYLMSLCNNFIISNGTFYWWAAYLGENDKSIVIAPKEGFVNLDATPLNWIKL